MACGNNESKSTQSSVSGKVHVLDAVQFKKKLAETPNPQLIDVRTSGEVADGLIDNAINIDYNGNDFDAKFKELDKKRPVFIYCQGGGRSGKAAKKLDQMGFTEIYDLGCGYKGWGK